MKLKLQRYIIEMQGYELDVMASPTDDFDGCFLARCNDTGDTLKINGWLIDSIEHVVPLTDILAAASLTALSAHMGA